MCLNLAFVPFLHLIESREMSGMRFLGTRIYVFFVQEKYALKCCGDIINLVFLCFRIKALSGILMAFSSFQPF